MFSRRLLLSLSVVPLLSGASQHPFHNELDEPEGYQFKWPINNVAIIGAGVSGLIAYRELSGAGFARVRVFERDDVPGGNWHYTEETPLEAPIPNADPSVGDFVPSLPPKGSSFPVEKYYSNGEAQWREHRGPKPVWESLESNAPAICLIRTLARYLRAFASFHGINSNDRSPDVAYNTRVELVEKRYDEAGQERGWTLTLKRLEQVAPKLTKATWWTEDFDAIVVATGRAISHSREYRRPQPTSGVEISREVNLHAKKIIQSVRPNPKLPYEAGRLQLQRLPANVSVVPEIRRFHASNSSIELVNGTFLVDVERVIFATGFRYSFPFLPQFPQLVVLVRASHLREETHLNANARVTGFPPVNWGMQSFTYSEYLSLALAKVWSRKAILPGTAELWRIYDRRIKIFLGGERTAANIRFFVGWLNDAAVKFGGKQIDGQSPDLPQISTVWQQAQYGVVFAQQPNQTLSALDWVHGEDW
ncbi:FAD/NAD(P)-binding domain-containing protein [Mycena olivaceomarginata]|nr:FAD/NAD(P)-binding domain-containing protein [Mycena olivaceomarginata]